MKRLISILTGLLIVGSFVAVAQGAGMGLIGAWLFDEGSGKEINDSAGNNHGEIQGDLKWVDGKLGMALEFAGAGDSYVSIPHHDVLDSDPYTFTAWIKLESVSWQYVVWKNGLTWPESHKKRHMDMWIHDADYPVIMWSADGADDYERVDGKAVVADGNWHHVAMSSDGKTMRLFIDGKLDGENLISGELLANEEDPMWIGARPGNVAATGIIDEVGFFTEALSEDQLKEVMGNGLEVLAPVEALHKLATIWGGLKADR